MQVKEILREFNIRPKKRLGQNFLISSYYLDKIVKTAQLKSIDVVVEIGAGVGNLTEILMLQAGKVVAVEKDENLFNVLSKLYGKNKEVKLIKNDFLNINLSNFYKAEGVKVKIFGNPPYYISTALIEKLITEKNYYQVAYLSFQKEYAERLLAKPRTKNYGRLTIFAQSFLDIKSLFKIPKNAFYPKPEVDTIFISLKPKADIQVKNYKNLDILTREFFQRRRKKIAKIVKDSILLKEKGIESALKLSGINLDLRPEELSVSDYIGISNILK